MEALVARVVNHSLRVVNHDLEIATILVFRPYALCILFQLRGVVGLGEEIFQEDRVWNPNRPQEVHGVPQLSAAHVPVAFEPNVSHLDLWALPDHESHAY